VRIALSTLCALLALTTTARAAVVVKPVTAPALKAAVAAHKGHVVVLNFWATWCDGCVQEFPGLVAVGKAYHARGVDLVTVSADTVRSIGTKVVPFLTKQGVSGTQYLQSPGDIDAFATAFDPQWQPAAYPSTYIYDRRGKLVRVLRTTTSRAVLKAIVKPLL